MLARVLGEEGEADEEDADAGLDDRVAAEQPLPDRREQVARRRGGDAVAGDLRRGSLAARRSAGATVRAAMADRRRRCRGARRVAAAASAAADRRSRRSRLPAPATPARPSASRAPVGARSARASARGAASRPLGALDTLAQVLDLALLAERAQDQPAEQRAGERARLAARGSADQRSQDDRDHAASCRPLPCRRCGAL